MFAFLNTTTFTIPSLSGEGNLVALGGGSATASTLRAAGVAEWTFAGGDFWFESTPGGSLPVILDTVPNPFYGYILRFAEDAGVCWIELRETPPNDNSYSTPNFSAQSDVPCRVQLHARTYRAMSGALGIGEVRELGDLVNLSPENGVLYLQGTNGIALTSSPSPSARTYWFQSTSGAMTITNYRFSPLDVYGASHTTEGFNVSFQGLAQITEFQGTGIMIVYAPGNNVPFGG